MLKKERLQWILEKINVKGVITVNDIIKELGVSDMTVRRDLDELDKEGFDGLGDGPMDNPYDDERF